MTISPIARPSASLSRTVATRRLQPHNSCWSTEKQVRTAKQIRDVLRTLASPAIELYSVTNGKDRFTFRVEDYKIFQGDDSMFLLLGIKWQGDPGKDTLQNSAPATNEIIKALVRRGINKARITVPQYARDNDNLVTLTVDQKGSPNKFHDLLLVAVD